MGCAQPAQAVRVGSDRWLAQGVSALGSPTNRNVISSAAFVLKTDGVVEVAVASPVTCPCCQRHRAHCDKPRLLQAIPRVSGHT